MTQTSQMFKNLTRTTRFLAVHNLSKFPGTVLGMPGSTVTDPGHCSVATGNGARTVKPGRPD